MTIKNPQYWAALYEKRTYNTYRARIELHKRLTKYRLWHRIASAVLDTTTIAWIVLPAAFNDISDVSSIELQIYVVLATFLTALSIVYGQFLEYLGLDTRILQAHQGYVQTQILSQKFELMRGNPKLTMDEVKAVIRDYEQILLMTENHQSKDFRKANI